MAIQVFMKIALPIAVVGEGVSNSFHNPDLLFSQPVKLVDQGVYLSIRGLYLAQKECLLVIRPAGREWQKEEALCHEGGHGARYRPRHGLCRSRCILDPEPPVGPLSEA
jgi:hypothetical protein